ncbi:MAG TPA: hypothetical protein VFR68_02135 [Candidatus Dormibacteraeota bacterium]|nr:hypothetical protein [Candidatus Dormibacteraeota bacterium]
MIEITIPLDEEEERELSSLAREARMSEQELIRRSIESLLLARRSPLVPRYARRLGPLTLAD